MLTTVVVAVVFDDFFVGKFCFLAPFAVIAGIGPEESTSLVRDLMTIFSDSELIRSQTVGHVQIQRAIKAVTSNGLVVASLLLDFEASPCFQ